MGRKKQPSSASRSAIKQQKLADLRKQREVIANTMCERGRWTREWAAYVSKPVLGVIDAGLLTPANIGMRELISQARGVLTNKEWVSLRERLGEISAEVRESLEAMERRVEEILHSGKLRSRRDFELLRRWIDENESSHPNQELVRKAQAIVDEYGTVK